MDHEQNEIEYEENLDAAYEEYTEERLVNTPYPTKSDFLNAKFLNNAILYR